MAVLEEEGLITQPHTSAGRIPTDAGVPTLRR
jgi:heat-inducible transcriptional repressor